MKTFNGGAIREDKSAKINYLLIPINALKRLALRFMFGASLHGANNWKLGNEEFMNGCKESAFRHFLQWLDGEKDEDHAYSIIVNIIMYEELCEKLSKTKTK